MHSRKAHPIDLHTEYPCPCRRQGRLVPMVLTEAFGCDRCHQIFVAKSLGPGKDPHLEQISSHYPYQRAWYWTGQQWRQVRPWFGQRLGLGLCTLGAIALFIGFLVSTQGSLTLGLGLRLFLVASLLLFLTLVIALTYRAS